MIVNTHIHLNQVFKALLLALLAMGAAGCDRLPENFGLKHSIQAHVLQTNAPPNYAQALLLNTDRAPEFVQSVRGFYAAEGFGRWTSGKFAAVAFKQPLPADFDVELTLAPSAGNVGKTATLWFGTQSKTIVLPNQPLEFTTVRATFNNPQSNALLVIEVPDPRSEFERTGSGDQRQAGLAVTSLHIRPHAKK